MPFPNKHVLEIDIRTWNKEAIKKMFLKCMRKYEVIERIEIGPDKFKVVYYDIKKRTNKNFNPSMRR